MSSAELPTGATEAQSPPETRGPESPPPSPGDLALRGLPDPWNARLGLVTIAFLLVVAGIGWYLL